ncbi:hypothetical protein NEMIN01_0207 [Nematocida minor]|uniref:uncharacterized protein n=1 Tax=Nematocida minor TaxID=1912983 RepID=UPI00221F9F1C|nr:uncharacterized protein NEMIN01_0103 [Nematocida minor]XP_051332109.1 uncharacterized protein NEMIN01_0207 [Nematocida minor]KAI5188839.1 hypothetical protein NEMIN01_0103 [Nematocida minor]KAI5188943.1 hypothetical protein NEMIN01_0207 [Nematocida minor]
MIQEKEKYIDRESEENENTEMYTGKPNIICCIQNKPVDTDTDGYGLPVRQRNLLSGIELEKRVPPSRPVYILKRQLSMKGIAMPILDVLDTRNTFQWVEMFRYKIVHHEWSEEEAKDFFKCCVSSDILENVVHDPLGQTLRDSVRKIYDKVYTQKNVELLRRRIDSLKSCQFLSLEAYKEELGLLIRSYSVRVLIAPEKQESFLQTKFWAGLSSSIKNLLSKKISSESSPNEIIRQVLLFKQKMFLRYNLPNNFTGVIYVKEKPNVLFPMQEQSESEEELAGEPESIQSIDCSRPPKKSNVVPMPSLKERVQPVLPSLKRMPKGIIIKNDLSASLVQIVKKYSRHKSPRIFKRPQIGKPFVVYTGCIGKWMAGILIQEKKAISIFKIPLMDEQIEYTETEKCILAIDRSKKIFQKIVGDSAIVFTSEKYKSFVYTNENGINFVDCMEIVE